MTIARDDVNIMDFDALRANDVNYDGSRVGRQLDVTENSDLSQWSKR